MTIGAEGNEPYTGPDPFNLVANRGRVDYAYRIGRHEVTTAQWVDFLNAMQFTNLSPYWEPFWWGGTIVETRPYFRFAVIDDSTANWPVGGIPWRAAAYYCNWLHNGRPTGFSSVWDGAYDAMTLYNDTITTVADQDTRHPDARYWIPSLDEWLKAVHYDPDRFGPGQGGWWDYPYRSNEPPVPGWPDEGGETSAGVEGNLNFDADVWRIPLGSYPDSMTPWGLLDASGGGTEWLEEWDRPHIFGNRSRVADGSPITSTTASDAITLAGGGDPDKLAPYFMSVRIASRVPSRVDLAEPWWELTFAEIAAFAQAFAAGDGRADLAEPYGVLDGADVVGFVGAFSE